MINLSKNVQSVIQFLTATYVFTLSTYSLVFGAEMATIKASCPNYMSIIDCQVVVREIKKSIVNQNGRKVEMSNYGWDLIEKSNSVNSSGKLMATTSSLYQGEIKNFSCSGGKKISLSGSNYLKKNSSVELKVICE